MALRASAISCSLRQAGLSSLATPASFVRAHHSCHVITTRAGSLCPAASAFSAKVSRASSSDGHGTCFSVASPSSPILFPRLASFSRVNVASGDDATPAVVEAPSGVVTESSSEPTPPPPPQPPQAADGQVDLKLADGLDLRVGRILKAWKHPEADSLYVEEVDVGEADGPRTICSGLVKYVPLEALDGRLVVVLANLKARNMRGVKSNGMLLAASDSSHENVELLSPPLGAEPGERVWFGEEVEKEQQQAALAPNQLQKKKVWEAVQPLLKTSDECVALLKDKPMRVTAGVVSCESLKAANIG